jgi:hypothetical protein
MPGMLPDPLLIGSILDLVGYLVPLTLTKKNFQDFELSGNLSNYVKTLQNSYSSIIVFCLIL